MMRMKRSLGSLDRPVLKQGIMDRKRVDPTTRSIFFNESTKLSIERDVSGSKLPS